jgi:hypothetical protein
MAEELLPDRADWLTADQVREGIESFGYEVPHTRLDRWRTVGLLPPSYRAGRGRGLGRDKALYHPITPRQAAAAAMFFADDRDDRSVGWRLWCGGYEVESQFALRPLTDAAKLWDDALPAMRGLVDSEDGNEAEELADRLYSASTSNRLFAQARKAVGPKRFRTLIFELCRVGAGVFDDLASNPSLATEDRIEAARVMDAAFGLTNARTDRVGSVGPLIKGDYSDALRAVSESLAGASLIHDLATTPLVEFRETARSLYLVTRGIAVFAEQLSDRLATNAFGLGRAKLIALFEMNTQALSILCWNRIGSHEDYRGRLAEIADLFIRAPERSRMETDEKLHRSRSVFPFEEWFRQQGETV